ncbi:HEAT repeat domain-containing protein [Candidatus Woesearchaeota archaeon]|nr:HEAT repeat domain-containing protein [Candidatus Woesearchaeota archaeon]
MKKYGLFVHPNVEDPSFKNSAFGRLEPSGRIACTENGHILQSYLDNRKIIQELSKTYEMRWMNDFWYAASRIIKGDPLDRFDFMITNFPPRRDATELSIRRGDKLEALARGKSPEERRNIFQEFTKDHHEFTRMLYERSIDCLDQIQENLPDLLIIIYTGAPGYIRNLCHEKGAHVLHRKRYGIEIETDDMRRQINKLLTNQELLGIIKNKTSGLQAAAQVLGSRKDESTVPDLISLLESPGFAMNDYKHIAQALGDIGDVRAIAPLFSFLEEAGHQFTGYDKDYGVCLALYRIGNENAGNKAKVVQGAIDYLNSRIMIDKRQFNWQHAAYVLGELRAEEGVDVLVELICEDYPKEKKSIAIDALGKIATEKATEGLRECVRRGFSDVVKARVSQYKYLLKRNPALKEFL